jgi:hypothetical protein
MGCCFGRESSNQCCNSGLLWPEPVGSEQEEQRPLKLMLPSGAVPNRTRRNDASDREHPLSPPKGCPPTVCRALLGHL